MTKLVIRHLQIQPALSHALSKRIVLSDAIGKHQYALVGLHSSSLSSHQQLRRPMQPIVACFCLSISHQ